MIFLRKVKLFFCISILLINLNINPINLEKLKIIERVVSNLFIRLCFINGSIRLLIDINNGDYEKAMKGIILFGLCCRLFPSHLVSFMD